MHQRGRGLDLPTAAATVARFDLMTADQIHGDGPHVPAALVRIGIDQTEARRKAGARKEAEGALETDCNRRVSVHAA